MKIEKATDAFKGIELLRVSHTEVARSILCKSQHLYLIVELSEMFPFRLGTYCPNMHICIGWSAMFATSNMAILRSASSRAPAGPHMLKEPFSRWMSFQEHITFIYKQTNHAGIVNRSTRKRKSELTLARRNGLIRGLSKKIENA